jgi:hypothetical protein
MNTERLLPSKIASDEVFASVGFGENSRSNSMSQR